MNTISREFWRVQNHANRVHANRSSIG